MTTILPALRGASLFRPFLNDLLADVDRFPWPTEFSADDTVGFRIDVSEYQDRYVLVADLPGRSTQDVDITLHNSQLSIEVRPQSQAHKSDGENVRLLVHERRMGAMKRTIKLPYAANEKDVDATLKDGVLTVTIRKEEASMPKKISVS